MSIFAHLPSPSTTVDYYSSNNDDKQKSGIPISFTPENRSFTICCEINAFQKSAGRILSNRSIDKTKGFELVVPRRWDGKISVCISGSHQNVGKTSLAYNQWYHITIVINKEYRLTQCDVYLNGNHDGTLGFLKYESLSTDNQCLIGNWNGHNGHFFDGEIRNLNIFYETLTPKQIQKIAFCHKYFSSFKEDILLFIQILFNERNWNIVRIPTTLFDVIAHFL